MGFRRLFRHGGDVNFAVWQPQSLLARYAFAAAVVGLGIALRYVLTPWLGSAGFSISLVAMLVAAWVGGLGPCLWGQMLTLWAHLHWFSSLDTPAVDPTVKFVAGVAAFFLVGLAIALLSEATRAAHFRAQARGDEAVSQREQTAATLSCIGDAVVVTNSSGRIAMMNPIAESLSGWSCADALGQPLETVFALIDERFDRMAASPLVRVVAEGAAVYCNDPLLLPSRSGERHPVGYSAAPISNALGHTTGVVLVFRDQSERRRHEQTLREADRRKDEFLATLAHELRNPLAPIRTGLELLGLSSDDPALFEETRSMMERQTQQMVRLIDDLLDISRITRGKLHLRKCEVELSAVVRDAIDAVRPLIDQFGHHLTVELPPQPLSLYADPHRLAQILSNLLNNAAKYTPPGGHIALTAARQGGDLVVSVVDTGLGIPADMSQRIFEMFTQIDRSAGRYATGLGIGLTLVQSLVELHEGSVRVQSEGPDRGSEFIVRLPLLLPEPNKEAAPSPPQPPADPAPGRRILVVDDNHDALATLSKIVKIMGHQVRTAGDGLEAVEVAEAFRPDTVLMDIGMPKVDGYEAARRIREHDWGQGIVLIATTGWGQEDDKQRTRDAGFDFHLVKPVDSATLQSVLADPPHRAVAT